MRLVSCLFATGLLYAAWAAAAKDELIYIGMHGSQIHAARFDPSTGKLTMIGPVADVPRPTWAVMHPSLPILYSVNEEGNDGLKDGSVYSFAVNRATGSLKKLNEVGARGGGTTQLALDWKSKTLLAANFGSGSAVTLPILPDGRLGEARSVRQQKGSGPHPRQKSAHAHAVTVDPTDRFALVADMGADRVFVYPFNRVTRELMAGDANPSRNYQAAAGTGPRQVVFHPNGRLAFLLLELSADLQTFSWDAKEGRLHLLQTISTNAPGFTGTSSVAEIQTSRDGRFVYVSNRGDHTVVVFSVDPKTGQLTPIQRIASGGTNPWSFSIDPGGQWMLVANEATDSINVFKIDRASGKMSATSSSMASPKPVSITFVDR